MSGRIQILDDKDEVDWYWILLVFRISKRSFQWYWNDWFFIIQLLVQT